jgi:predicted ATPase/tetratricopeptide (TPR) repeat protein
MRALALSGQRGAALAQYEACCRILREELGIGPAEETRALYELIRNGEDLPGTRSRPPSVPSENGSLCNLPAQLTPFIGRERELAKVAKRLADPKCRLLTLVGPGGSGKTRLALEAAARELTNYPHGVVFVSLTPLQSVEAIVPTVAQAIGLSVHGSADLKRQLLYYLRDKQMLLVIDNLEHLLAFPGEKGDQQEGGGEILLEVLRAAAKVRLLVTTRIRLNASMEYVLDVPGMNVPPSSRERVLEYSAVQLYLQQARRVRPDYEPDSDALAGIARVCRLVGGMPLAIVLAAAWSDVLSPGEIASELEQSITFLRGDLRDLPQRHRSMVATFDASWSMLGEAERDAFAAVSVFSGGCTREAVEVVAGANLEILRSLVRKSFLTRDEHGRYQVHELLRQYAEDKLHERPGAWERVHDWHCAFYAQYVGERKDSFRKLGPGEARLEIDNVRTAWRWMLKRGKLAQCRQALGGAFWFDQGPAWHSTARPLLESTVVLLRHAEPSRENQIALGMALCYLSISLLETEPENAPALAREGHQILTEVDARRELAEAKMLAFIAGMADDDAAADCLLQESLSFARETDAPIEEAWALAHLGARDFVRAMVGGGPKGEAWERAQKAFSRELEIYRRIGHRRGEAIVLLGQASCAHAKRQYPKAKRLFEESLARFRALDERTWVLYCLLGLGALGLATGDHTGARVYYMESLNAAQADGNLLQARYALCGLGDVALVEEEPRKAVELYLRAVQGAIEVGGFSGVERIMLSMAKLSMQRGERVRAAELLAFAYHIVALHAPWDWGEVGLAGGRELERALQEDLSPEDYVAAQARGRARDIEGTLHELLVELEAELSKEVEGPSG